MRIFFSVGEPSGDLHGSNLIRRLVSSDPDIEAVGFGGPKMAEAGCDVHFDLTSMAVMFIADVLKNIRLFFRLIDQANTYFENNHVDAVVLIDYPGFNWWIARKAKKHGIPVFYYGVPQVWASAPWRVRKIRKLVDHVICKLPFEVDWFAARNCHATYVGHPYFDQIAGQEYDESLIRRFHDSGEKVITLLPGSRNREVESVLPLLLETARKILARTDDCRIVIAYFNERQRAMSSRWVAESGLPIETFVGKTPELMKAAYTCVACSGSVSMELLHHRKPTVIVYKIQRWAMFAQAFFLRAKFITLVNLIAATDIRRDSWRPYDPDASDAEPCVMPEYLTCGDPADKIAQRIVRWVNEPGQYNAKVKQMDRLASQYAIPGATERAADYILEKLTAESNNRHASPQMNSDNCRKRSNQPSAA